MAAVRFPELPVSQEKGAKPFAPMEVVVSHGLSTKEYGIAILLVAL